MILLIDNYDSFVYNLGRYVSELGMPYLVKRNNSIRLEEIAHLNPSHIILSPGPCTPNEAGISMDAIKTFGSSIPILGVCLGHQAIGQVYGGKVVRAKCPMHGKASYITHEGTDLFAKLPQPLKVGRYHSLIVSEVDFPAELNITARSEEGEIMAMKHQTHPVWGVQFHPESILTEGGHALLQNFLNNFERVTPQASRSRQ
jgi:anthranilate synthase/aminodeoxychorismate synthase-like glutamine amidotransferase